MILPKIRVLHSHGRQAIPDLDAVELTPEFRGRPCLTETRDADDAEHAAAVCPTGAFTAAPLALDLGRCLFCGECARIAPRNVRFTNDYRIGSPTREGLVVRPGDPPHSVRRRKGASRNPPLLLPRIAAARSLGRGRRVGRNGAGGHGQRQFRPRPLRHRLHGLAAPCRRRGGLRPRHGQHGRGAGNLLRRRRGTQNLVACGSEACSGGLFADSRAVDRTFFDTHTPDLWLPGAPTHPMTYIDGMMNLLGRKTRQ